MTASSSASSPDLLPTGREILEHLDEPLTVFVFPSEVSARFWLRWALGRSRRRALRADRFLDWGDFKKRYLRFGEGRRAVSRADRTVFAWRTLEENRRQSFFRALVPPEHSAAPQVYLSSLVRSLPGLARLPAVDRRWPEASGAKRTDLLLLLKVYRQFLADSSLYEPSFELPGVETGEQRVLIFFPEVIEDFQQYAALIDRHPGIATVAVPPVPPSAQTVITVHDDLVLELDRALDCVAALLDQGTDPQDIIVSVTDLSGLEGSLSRRAELRAIPLVIHRSHPVLAFPTARMFRQIQALESSRFSLDPLKDLLVNRALPWRQPALARGLIRLGLDQRLLRSLPDARDGGWERAFAHAEAIGNPRGLPLADLRRFYRRMHRYLSEIWSARTFHSLKERTTGFARALLDTSQWQPAQLGAFQFALDKLDELEEAGQEELPAFALWLSYLGEELYLPRMREGGVPVYDYPVAEGTAPSYHYLLNASQEGTSRRLKPLPALNPCEEESLGLQELELGPEHLRLFLHSGRRVSVGYSRRGLSRTHLPPALFVTQGSLRTADPSRGDPAGDGPELRERLAWTSGESFPLVALQRLGFLHAQATALAPRGLDAAAAPIGDPDLCGRLMEPLARGLEGGAKLRVSPTALERFHACPFAFLLQNCVGLTVDDYVVVTSDPRELGAIMHRVLEAFVRELQPETGEDGVRLQASRRGEYRDLIHDTVRRVCRSWARRNPLPFSPLWMEIQDRARELALDFLEVELKEMAGELITEVELRMEAPFAQDPEVLLVGKIDRVSEREGRITVVDYKKNETPSAARIFGPEAISFQMPFYMHLMEAAGRPVERAAYYSMEKRKFTLVLGGDREAPVSPEARAEVRERLEGRIADMVRRVRDGDYAIAAAGSTACRRCDHGAVCRRRYLLGAGS